MSPLRFRIVSTLAGALLTMLGAAPAMADDIEIYRAHTGVRPNVLFILDTSGSMDTTVIQTPPSYDPNTTYTGSCNPDRIYYTTSNTTPTCSGNWFPRTSNTCKASQAALVNLGGSGVWPALGNARQRAAQLRSSEWRSIQSGNTGWVECQADDGIHGQTDASTSLFPRNSSTGWSTTDRDVWDDISTTYRFFTANYLNYYYSVGQPVAMTRLEIVRNVATELTSTLTNVNLGLMRYSLTAQGGYVLNAVEDISTNRDQILDTLNTFDPDDGSGLTPLSETYYEAARYLTGRSVFFGNTSLPGTSVAASRITGSSPSTYKTPIVNKCQKNYIVYLTDGAPTFDANANADIATMIGKSACAADPVEPYHDLGWTPGSGVCMDDLAEWLATTDLSTTYDGDQVAQTYVVGFGNDVAASVGYLNTIAAAGGTGTAFTAGDVPTLTAALQSIFNDIQETSGTFITPTISVNAFNRAQASTDLYFSVFRVSAGPHWLGNVKKYRLINSVIVDDDDEPAVDSAGFFSAGSRSIWSPTTDGNDVAKGGAVSRLPAPASRKIYTWLDPNEKRLTEPVNAFSLSNTALTDARVGSGSSTTACSTLCNTTIKWTLGYDVRDANHDGSFTDADPFMGDPLHGKPALVAYGGSTSSPDPEDVVVYVPTNDGFLHAIKGRSGSGGGEELWAFIPPVLLPRLYSLYENVTAVDRTYGLDGDVRVLKIDHNGDGIVSTSEGDKVWLYFGMRMGGDRYYGLDVTNPAAPKLMFILTPTELPGVGQSWSPPTIARVKVGSANDNADNYVLIFGGGYDMGQEVQPYSVDDVGNRLFIVDAETGDRLWFAGPTGAAGSPNFTHASMTNAFPGRITVIDTDGDHFADRMYASDLGGRVWRFDITNGAAAGSLVAGGVLAKLGTGDNGTPAATEARRLYNAPDVALVQRRRQSPYFNIALGSGHRGRPLEKVTEDWFFSIRDKRPFARLTQQQYDQLDLDPIVLTDLRDITADPMGTQVLTTDPGWRLNVSGRTGRAGEKTLAEATTLNGVILFPTFQPLDVDPNDPCFPSNRNRVYAITVDGKPALDFNDDPNDDADDGVINNADISMDLNQTGIVGEVNIAIHHGAGGGDEDEEEGGEGGGEGGGGPDDGSDNTDCLAGISVLNKCVGIGGTVRTFWQRSDTQ